MATRKPRQSGNSYFPFTDDEYEAFKNQSLAEPSLFNEIREAARVDVVAILDQMVPVLFDKHPLGGIPFVLLDGPVSRDAFLKRIRDVLMHHYHIEGKLPGDGSPIPKNLYYGHELDAAKILVTAAFQGRFERSALEELNVHLILLKTFASVLEMHGQISDSISLLNHILVLLRIRKDIEEGKEILNVSKKKVRPFIRRLEIVFGILHYLDRGILPARIHLQNERGVNESNFSGWFAPLSVAKIIPSGSPPKSKLFRTGVSKLFKKKEEHSYNLAYYTLAPDAPKPGPADAWPAYMQSKVIRATADAWPASMQSKRAKASGDVIHALLNWTSMNYVGHRERSAEECFRPGRDPVDVRHNIDLLKTRLGGIYWHLLSVLTLDDLSGPDDLDDFLRGLRGLGLSLDF